jgi:hypothetical protein
VPHYEENEEKKKKKKKTKKKPETMKSTGRENIDSKKKYDDHRGSFIQRKPIKLLLFIAYNLEYFTDCISAVVAQ